MKDIVRYEAKGRVEYSNLQLAALVLGSVATVLVLPLLVLSVAEGVGWIAVGAALAAMAVNLYTPRNQDWLILVEASKAAFAIAAVALSGRVAVSLGVEAVEARPVFIAALVVVLTIAWKQLVRAWRVFWPEEG